MSTEETLTIDQRLAVLLPDGCVVQRSDVGSCAVIYCLGDGSDVALADALEAGR